MVKLTNGSFIICSDGKVPENYSSFINEYGMVVKDCYIIGEYQGFTENIHYFFDIKQIIQNVGDKDPERATLMTWSKLRRACVQIYSNENQKILKKIKIPDGTTPWGYNIIAVPNFTTNSDEYFVFNNSFLKKILNDYSVKVDKEIMKEIATTKDDKLFAEDKCKKLEKYIYFKVFLGEDSYVFKYNLYKRYEFVKLDFIKNNESICKACFPNFSTELIGFSRSENIGKIYVPNWKERNLPQFLDARKAYMISPLQYNRIFMVDGKAYMGPKPEKDVHVITQGDWTKLFSDNKLEHVITKEKICECEVIKVTLISIKDTEVGTMTIHINNEIYEEL